jgi:pimeloyl-ACP methyl ester carboxylesterase
MDEIDAHRRRFLAAAGMVAAAAQFGMSARAQAAETAPSAAKPGMEASFGPLKQIDAGVLNVAYAEAGPANGPAVILLHGWPYDIYSFVEAAPLLASAGFRVIVPYLRGYGATRFLADATVRNGQPSAVAVDMIALMDALKIDKAVLAGFDWGARTADIIAALWPERCKGLVSVSGYLIGGQEAGKMPLPPGAELQWWYQFYFATERGRLGYEKYRHDFSKLIWRLASPKWDFDDATFDRSAAAFDNADHVAIVIHNYRWRLGLAEGAIRQSGETTCGEPRHRHAHHHHGRGRERRAASGAWRLCQEILRPLRASADQGRHRPQSAAGSAEGFRAGNHRHRRRLNLLSVVAVIAMSALLAFKTANLR